MNEQSLDESTEEFIELVELEDDDSQEIDVIRKSFRIPVRDKENYVIVINRTPFPLDDINEKGAGVVMVKDHSFVRGMTVDGCEVILGDDHFTDVACEIVHVSSKEDSPILFGVKWISIGYSIGSASPIQLGDVCRILKRELLDAGDGEDDFD